MKTKETSMFEAMADYFESFDETALLAPDGVLTDEASGGEGEASITGGEIISREVDIIGTSRQVYTFSLNVTAPALTHTERAEARTRLEMLSDALADADKNDILPEFEGKTCEQLTCGAPELTGISEGGTASYKLPVIVTITERI